MADAAEVFIELLIRDAGTWSLDLSSRTAHEGPDEPADCKVTADRATFGAILDRPSFAMQAFMTGKLKATNTGLETGGGGPALHPGAQGHLPPPSTGEVRGYGLCAYPRARSRRYAER